MPGGRRPPNSASNDSGEGAGIWFRPEIFGGCGSVGAEDVILFLASESFLQYFNENEYSRNPLD